jgi:hypothetical protein
MGWDEHPMFEVLQRINCGTVYEKTSLNAWLLSPLSLSKYCVASAEVDVAKPNACRVCVKVLRSARHICTVRISAVTADSPRAEAYNHWSCL